MAHKPGNRTLFEVLVDAVQPEFEELVREHGASLMLRIPAVGSGTLFLRNLFGAERFGNIMSRLTGVMNLTEIDRLVDWAGHDRNKNKFLHILDELINELGPSMKENIGKMPDDEVVALLEATYAARATRWAARTLGIQGGVMRNKAIVDRTSREAFHPHCAFVPRTIEVAEAGEMRVRAIVEATTMQAWHPSCVSPDKPELTRPNDRGKPLRVAGVNQVAFADLEPQGITIHGTCCEQLFELAHTGGRRIVKKNLHLVEVPYEALEAQGIRMHGSCCEQLFAKEAPQAATAARGTTSALEIAGKLQQQNPDLADRWTRWYLGLPENDRESVNEACQKGKFTTDTAKVLMDLHEGQRMVMVRGLVPRTPIDTVKDWFLPKEDGRPGASLGTLDFRVLAGIRRLARTYKKRLGETRWMVVERWLRGLESHQVRWFIEAVDTSRLTSMMMEDLLGQPSGDWVNYLGMPASRRVA